LPPPRPDAATRAAMSMLPRWTPCCVERHGAMAERNAATGGAPTWSWDLEEAARLACGHDIRFHAAVLGCIPHGKFPLQVRPASDRRPFLFLPYYYSLPISTFLSCAASTGRRPTTVGYSEQSTCCLMSPRCFRTCTLTPWTISCHVHMRWTALFWSRLQRGSTIGSSSEVTGSGSDSANGITRCDPMSQLLCRYCCSPHTIHTSPYLDHSTIQQ
jgi:hypothetical protein